MAYCADLMLQVQLLQALILTPAVLLVSLKYNNHSY